MTGNFPFEQVSDHEGLYNSGPAPNQPGFLKIPIRYQLRKPSFLFAQQYPLTQDVSDSAFTALLNRAFDLGVREPILGC
jgi:hypothetical protein